jgi:hypothetical protein
VSDEDKVDLGFGEHGPKLGPVGCGLHEEALVAADDDPWDVVAVCVGLDEVLPQPRDLPCLLHRVFVVGVHLHVVIAFKSRSNGSTF